MSRFPRDRRAPRRYRTLPSLRPSALELCAGGHILLLLAVEDMLLRLGESSAEALLYLEHFTGAVSSALVLLWLGVLGLDLAERRLFPPS